jgi:hypothetical protein
MQKVYRKHNIHFSTLILTHICFAFENNCRGGFQFKNCKVQATKSQGLLELRYKVCIDIAKAASSLANAVMGKRVLSIADAVASCLTMKGIAGGDLIKYAQVSSDCLK